MPAQEHEIEITGRTVLRIGGFRITIEPEDVPGQRTDTLASLKIGHERPIRPWHIPEADRREQALAAFEPERACNVERLSFVPRAGGTFRAVGGLPVDIARVVGRDRSLWFVLDASGRPFAVRRIDAAWHALPPSPAAPVPGDVIVHTSAESTIAEVVGKAEVGGWVVVNNAGISLHVLRSEAGRWMSLGMAEVRA